MHILDPIEQMNNNIEKLIDQFIDDRTCMICKKRVNYDLICVSPTGDGPAVCEDCL